MTQEDFWQQTHKKMIDKLNEVLPIINEDSPNFIELDWCDEK
jgi:Txe/YoeB family toxin of Txe-Axe toxin-antitoxin module